MTKAYSMTSTSDCTNTVRPTRASHYIFDRRRQCSPADQRRNAAMASFPNVYTHRKVAEAASKRCEICFKPSTSVLVTPDKQVRLIISSLLVKWQPLTHPSSVQLSPPLSGNELQNMTSCDDRSQHVQERIPNPALR